MESKLTELELLAEAMAGRASVAWNDGLGLVTWDGRTHAVSCWLQQQLADLFDAKLPLAGPKGRSRNGLTWVLAEACWAAPDRYSPPMPAVDNKRGVHDVRYNDGKHFPWLQRGPDDTWAHLPGTRHPAVPKIKPAEEKYIPLALRIGAKGRDVAELQRKLGLEVTGHYDASVAKAVETYQKDHGLGTDGVFNDATRRCLYHKPEPKATLGAATRVLARNFTPGRTEPVRVVCIHEIPADFPAQDVAELFAHPKRPPQASVHYVLGTAGDLYLCVPEQHTAWGAPGCNAYAVHVVVVGGADYHDLLIDICGRHGLPTTWINAAELIDGKKGVVSHAMVRQALEIAKEKTLVKEPWFNTKYGVFRNDKSCLVCCEG